MNIFKLIIYISDLPHYDTKLFLNLNNFFKKNLKVQFRNKYKIMY